MAEAPVVSSRFKLTSQLHGYQATSETGQPRQLSPSVSHGSNLLLSNLYGTTSFRSISTLASHEIPPPLLLKRISHDIHPWISYVPLTKEFHTYTFWCRYLSLKVLGTFFGPWCSDHYRLSSGYEPDLRFVSFSLFLFWTRSLFYRPQLVTTWTHQTLHPCSDGFFTITSFSSSRLSTLLGYGYLSWHALNRSPC